jgi:hypothetical protein
MTCMLESMQRNLQSDFLLYIQVDVVEKLNNNNVGPYLVRKLWNLNDCSFN